ncbi:MAG TPA: peroxiredoxin [candidate division WOR-3 bacterium]|uniref:thioredoxin-dependent peroxiredoxin n=1 Tax=candidate division WOR-3 bacterium TaxID=2052148 RepID=A0A7C0VDE4_UNCW3|nr:peroxiredoxin [candidate division WOR-3 bacterium]
MVEEGKKAKAFCLEGIDPEGNNGEFCLKDFLNREKYIILYFYPRDNTSGCTKEATGFRDAIPEIEKEAFVIGISPDTVESHRKFMDKHGLNFYLLSDREKKVMMAYGAYGEKRMYGKTTMGVIRSTFLIAPDGKVIKVWRKVKVKGHIEEVIRTLKSL